MSLESIVNVNITRATASVSRLGFGTFLIAGENKADTELIKYYSNLAAVGLDYFTTDPEYLAAQSGFSQSPTVTQIAIGRRETADTSVLTVTAADSFTYTIEVEGQIGTYTSGVSETTTVIAAGLVAALGAVSGITVTDNLNGTIDFDPVTPGTAYTIKVRSGNLALAFITSQTVSQDLDAIAQSDNDWYGLVLTSRVQADVEAAAAWTETKVKLFLTASSDTDIAGTTDAADTTTVAATLKAASYARSGVLYYTLAASVYPEAAWFGVILPLTPGSYTAKFKTLKGITVDNLDDTQQKNILDKNANFYQITGGKNITCNGTVAEGEYIDVIVFVDWLDVNITAEVFTLLVNLPKVPFTDAGIAGIEAAITSVLQLGVVNGGIPTTDGEDPPGNAYSVSVPKAVDVPAVDKANRTLNNVTFTALLSGAIHAVVVNGTVTI